MRDRLVPQNVGEPDDGDFGAPQDPAGVDPGGAGNGLWTGTVLVPLDTHEGGFWGGGHGIEELAIDRGPESMLWPMLRTNMHGAKGVPTKL